MELLVGRVQGLQNIKVHREPTFDDWANRRKSATIVTEVHLERKRRKLEAKR